MVNDIDDLWGGSDSEGDAPPARRGAGAGGNDMWGSDDDDDRVAAGAGGGREAMSLRDEQSARMKHYKEGYKDAVGQAREDALQEGFGIGFKQSFAVGIRSGRLVGYCSARRALKGDAKGDPCDSSAGAELSSL